MCWQPGDQEGGEGRRPSPSASLPATVLCMGGRRVLSALDGLLQCQPGRDPRKLPPPQAGWEALQASSISQQEQDPAPRTLPQICSPSKARSDAF